MDKKICPLKFSTGRVGLPWCLEERCAWWVAIETTEGKDTGDSGCAVRLLGMQAFLKGV